MPISAKPARTDIVMTGSAPDGLILLLPEVADAAWLGWLVEAGALGEGVDLPRGDVAQWLADRPEAQAVTVLVPASLAPVSDRPLPDLPLAQALAAARLGGGSADGPHVAVAAQGDRLLLARVAAIDMDLWLASLAGEGLGGDAQPGFALVPAALVLPRPGQGAVTATLGGQPLARSPEAAFAGESALVAALAGGGSVTEVGVDDLAARLLAVHAAPPLDLRQGAYAPRRVRVFALPDWQRLARLAALAALLVMALLVVRIVRWNGDADARVTAALDAAHKRFPGAIDLDGAERLANAERTRRDAGVAGFGAPTAALLGAIQPLPPTLRLRELAWTPDGAMRVSASAVRPADLAALAEALRREGWTVEAPDAAAPTTGATLATITLRMP